MSSFIKCEKEAFLFENFIENFENIIENFENIKKFKFKW